MGSYPKVADAMKADLNNNLGPDRASYSLHQRGSFYGAPHGGRDMNEATQDLVESAVYWYVDLADKAKCTGSSVTKLPSTEKSFEGSFDLELKSGSATTNTSLTVTVSVQGSTFTCTISSGGTSTSYAGTVESNQYGVRFIPKRSEDAPASSPDPEDYTDQNVLV